MVEDLTSLGVTANQVDAEVGEDGKEDEDDELSHRDDSKRELENYASCFAKRLIVIAKSAYPRYNVNPPGG